MLSEYSIARAWRALWQVTRPVAERATRWMTRHVKETVAASITFAEQQYILYQQRQRLALCGGEPPASSLMVEMASCRRRTKHTTDHLRHDRDENHFSKHRNECMIDNTPHSVTTSSAIYPLNDHDAMLLHCLECALRSQESLSRIQAIVRHHTYILDRLDPDGLTPLHRACLSCAPIDVVLYLISSCPRTLLQSTFFQGNWPDFLPIHFVCLFSTSWCTEPANNNSSTSLTVCDIVNCMITLAGADLLARQNRSRSTPLHYAIKATAQQTNHDAILPLIRLLVTTYPAAVNCPDQNNKTPLDYAIERNVTWSIVRLLACHATDTELATRALAWANAAENADCDDNDEYVVANDEPKQKDWVWVDFPNVPVHAPEPSKTTADTTTVQRPELFSACVD